MEDWKIKMRILHVGVLSLGSLWDGNRREPREGFYFEKTTETARGSRKRDERRETRQRDETSGRSMASAAVMKKGGVMESGAVSLTSAQGLIALMEEEDDRLRAYALKQLDQVVPDLWFEVSAAITTIEALYEDEKFPERSLAALLASKVRRKKV